MTEFDPIRPRGADEAAYADALLDDDGGQERRRVRLMAALPRPQADAAVPVSQATWAWRSRPSAWVLLAAGLLLLAALALTRRPAEPKPAVDPRWVASQAASTPTVLAQADPAAAPRPAPAAEVAPTAAKPRAAKPGAAQPSPVVVADATVPQASPEAATPAPEAGAPSAQPPAAQVAAAPAAPDSQARPRAEAAAPAASAQAEILARRDLMASMAARRRAPTQAAQSLAASEAAQALPGTALLPADARLLMAVTQADPAAVRSALRAGASAQVRDAQGRTMLMLAARSGAREVVGLLLAAGSRKADRDPAGWTAADHAEALGHGHLAALLREQGGDPLRP